MNIQIHSIFPQLKPYIKAIWSLTSDSSSANCHNMLLPPTGLFELCFHLCDYPQKRENHQMIRKPKFLLGGQQSGLNEFGFGPKSSFIMFYFQPVGVYSILGLPLKELSNHHLDIEHFFKEEISFINDQIYSLKSMSERAVFIQQIIHNKILQTDVHTDERVKHWLHALADLDTHHSVDSLSEMFWLSKRQLEREFAKHIGISPKAYIKVLRFQKALHFKQMNNSIDLIELALRAGYYDQSHMNRDFKALCGYSPKKFFELEPARSDFYSKY